MSNLVSPQTLQRYKNVDMDTDTDSPTNFNTVEVCERRIDHRAVLEPLFEQLMSLYESEDADHPDMPSIDNVVDVIQGKIHDLNKFFMKLRRWVHVHLPTKRKM